MNAKKVVVITDNLVEYPLVDFSIPEVYVDYVVAVDQIGDPAGIVSGTTKITRDPVGLKMASYAAKVIDAFRTAQGRLLLPDWCGGAIPGYCKIRQRDDAWKKASMVATVWAVSPDIWLICWKKAVSRLCWTYSAST